MIGIFVFDFFLGEPFRQNDNCKTSYLFWLRSGCLLYLFWQKKPEKDAATILLAKYSGIQKLNDKHFNQNSGKYILVENDLHNKRVAFIAVFFCCLPMASIYLHLKTIRSVGEESTIKYNRSLKISVMAKYLKKRHIFRS